MRTIIAILVALLASAGPSMAYDVVTLSFIERFKPGKLVPADELVNLMMGAELWCYNQHDDECGWSDIYLSADDDGASYELSNPWNEKLDISFVDNGAFRDDRYFCETGTDWVPSVRAYFREDGVAIEGRELAALREEISAQVQADVSRDCFDYLYRGYDETAQTITLVQRKFTGGVHADDEDAEVTLHFDKANAENLGWYL